MTDKHPDLLATKPEGGSGEPESPLQANPVFETAADPLPWPDDLPPPPKASTTS